MYDAIDRAPDTISKFNTIKDHANAIFEQFKGKGQEPLGKIIRDRILDQFKIPGALNVTDADQAGDGCDVGASEKADRISGGIRKGHDQDFPELDRDRERDEVRRDEQRPDQRAEVARRVHGEVEKGGAGSRRSRPKTRGAAWHLSAHRPRQ